MAELAERRQLWDGGADAAVPHGLLAALMRTPISPPISGVDSAPRPPRPPAPPARRIRPSGASPSQNSLAYGNPGAAAGGPQLLSNLASVERGVSPEIINHYNVQPVFDIYANVDRRDLGSVGAGGREDHAGIPANCRAAPVSICAARCAPWKLRFTGWAWA